MLLAVLLYIIAGSCVTVAVNYAFGSRDTAVETAIDILFWPILLYYLVKNLFNA